MKDTNILRGIFLCLAIIAAVMLLSLLREIHREHDIYYPQTSSVVEPESYVPCELCPGGGGGGAK